MKYRVGDRFLLGGATQSAKQWDGSRYVIQTGEIITLLKSGFMNDLYRVESDGRIVGIDSSIVERYFVMVVDELQSIRDGFGLSKLSDGNKSSSGITHEKRGWL